MITDVLRPEPEWAEMQVLRIQTKLHRWATDDPGCRFDDLFNLVYDPAVLVVAWARVRGNRGKRSAGVDGIRPDAIFSAEEEFLPRLREDLKARQFAPMPVRERMIPKPGSSKRRRLGIPTARDQPARGLGLPYGRLTGHNTRARTLTGLSRILPVQKGIRVLRPATGTN